MKTSITSDTVEFSYNDRILLTLDKSLFASLWSEKMLYDTALKLQNRYKEVAFSDKPHSYFEERLIDVMERVIEEKLEIKFQNESKYIQAFLKYHIRTLRSIRRLINAGPAAKYIDTELFNLQSLSSGDLFSILDSIDIKSKNAKSE